jgi:hypothetical protein
MRTQSRPRRLVTLAGVLLALGAAALDAQHAHQFELGGFATYTRYDRALQLANQFGGGARLAFFFSDRVAMELEGSLAGPSLKPAVPGVGPTTRVLIGSASVVVNSIERRNILYFLGGYSRLGMGANPPYDFALNALHGAVGGRIRLGRRVALRLEARGFYAPSNSHLGGHAVWQAQGSAGLAVILGAEPRKPTPPVLPRPKRDSIVVARGKPPVPPAATPPTPPIPKRDSLGIASGKVPPPLAPAPPRPRATPRFVQPPSAFEWLVGAQVGLLKYRTNVQPYHSDPIIGWQSVFRAKRAGVLVSYELAFFTSDARATLVEPIGTSNPGNVSFKNARRVMLGPLLFPFDKPIQPFLGAGVALQQVLQATVTCNSCVSKTDLSTMQTRADDAATRVLVWGMGGLEVQRRNLAFFAHYLITSGANKSLIEGPTYTFQSGVRYRIGIS